MKIVLDQAYSFYQLGQRSNQEDARYPDADVPNMDAAPFFAVCDGVGGADGGELASATVCQALGRFMDDQDSALPFTLEDFQEGMSGAYRALYAKMDDVKNYEMATTLVFLYFSASGVAMAHIGDSRIYQIRPGEGIVYRTEDHSLVNEMVLNGEITPQEAEGHPLRNCITRCLNFVPKGEEVPYTDFYMTRDVRAGDYFFLCSDGVLHNMTDDDLVQLLCCSEGTDKEKMDMIAHESASAYDNNTAILVRVGSVELEDYEKDPSLMDWQIAQAALSRQGHGAKGLTISYGLTPIQPQLPAKSISRRLSGLFRK